MTIHIWEFGTDLTVALDFPFNPLFTLFLKGQ